MYGFYDASAINGVRPGVKEATSQPIVTGTSVLGIKFADGVVIAADNLGALFTTLELSLRQFNL